MVSFDYYNLSSTRNSLSQTDVPAEKDRSVAFQQPIAHNKEEN
jgi:hypothetical protein